MPKSRSDERPAGTAGLQVVSSNAKKGKAQTHIEISTFEHTNVIIHVTGPMLLEINSFSRLF